MNGETPNEGEASGDSQSPASDPKQEEPTAVSEPAVSETAAAEPVAPAMASPAPAAEAAAKTEDRKHRAMADLRKRVLTVAVPLLFVSVALGVLVGVLGWQSGKDSEATKPLVDLATTFPVPPGSEIAFPRTVDDTPPVVVLGWKNEGASIDRACGQWRDAFRAWVSDADPGSVQGSVIEGQSCSLTARKDNANVTLIVAVYGSEPPQATLTVAE